MDRRGRLFDNSALLLNMFSVIVGRNGFGFFYGSWAGNDVSKVFLIGDRFIAFIAGFSS